jgi:hypothetical protein
MRFGDERESTNFEDVTGRSAASAADWAAVASAVCFRLSPADSD